MATIFGTANNDSLTSGAEGDVLLGLGGSDTLLGGGGGDSLSGSDGEDLINGGTGADTMSGGDGEDTFVILSGDASPAAPDVITDWTSDDRFSFATGPGAYQETSAPDAGRTHANTLIAAGARFVAVQTPTGVIVYMDTAANGGQAEDAVLLLGRTLDDISAINVGSAETLPTAPMGPPELPPGPTPTPEPPPNPNPNQPTSPPPPPPSLPPVQPPSETPIPTAFPGGGPDLLRGTPGADTLSGSEGDDYIYNSAGDDFLDGGRGIDTLDLSEATSAVSYTMHASQAPSGGLGDDDIFGFERIVGSRFNDRLAASGAGSTISGGAGDDELRNSVGYDAPVALYGEAGDDRIEGLGLLVGGIGNDTIVSRTFAQAGSQLEGGEGADSLTGDDGADSMLGGEGADTLEGRGGQDTLVGGAGADVFSANHSQLATAEPDIVTDWQVDDRLRFFDVPATYAETTAAALAGAREAAASRIGSGEVNYLAVQVGADVYVFGEGSTANTVGAVFRLAGRTLNDVTQGNIVGPAAPELAAPAPPTRSYSGSAGRLYGDVEQFQPASMLSGTVFVNSPTTFDLSGPGGRLRLTGTDITYREDANFVYEITGGTAKSLSILGPSIDIEVSLGGFPAATLFALAQANAMGELLSSLFAGNDNLIGNGAVLRGYTGDDRLSSINPRAAIYGGAGDDQIFGDSALSSATTYLRGDEGNDYLRGGAGFDDINGNMGNDTATGGIGADWVVGGKDDDLLFGDAGDDLVYGNLGSDTCYGGEGADIVRGGQGDDVVHAGAGADFVSGDLGNDTLSGGAGADTFNTFAATGLDRVLDFSIADGDRVQLAPGTQYTVAQVDGDTVISMTGGGQMILVGVTASNLPAGWIFGA